MVFNVLISNLDDHLRNHGFLCRDPSGWRLSPAYDLNPVPAEIRPRVLATSIGLDDPSASLPLALETAGYYGLSAGDAKRIVSAVSSATSRWRTEAVRHGIEAHEIDRMASAFEHGNSDSARRIRATSSRGSHRGTVPGDS
mgnify:CR=1 FL=1